MKWLTLFLQLLPTVLQLIQSVEAVIGSGNGAAKKAIVMSAVDIASQSNSQVANATSVFIDKTVAALNAAKILLPPTVVAIP